MKIAVPTADGKLAMHFGHCEAFTLVEVDPTSRQVKAAETVNPPPHEPGVLPTWLASLGVSVVIAGGMGQRAQGLFAERGIKVVVGAQAEPPEDLVKAYLSGRLATGANVCDH